MTYQDYITFADIILDNKAESVQYTLSGGLQNAIRANSLSSAGISGGLIDANLPWMGDNTSNWGGQKDYTIGTVTVPNNPADWNAPRTIPYNPEWNQLPWNQGQPDQTQKEWQEYQKQLEKFKQNFPPTNIKPAKKKRVRKKKESKKHLIEELPDQRKRKFKDITK